VPVGGIIMWSGSSAAAASIPNWHICDGTNGTPDLRERFIIGAGSNPVNATGGTASTTLSLANLPSHSHTIAPHGHGVSDAGHTHSVTDPVHNHTLSDPTHTHTVGDPGHDHHVADPGHAHWFPVCSDGGSGASAGGRSCAAAPNEATLVAGTGVTVSASASGISLGYGATNITLGGARTGVGIGASATNIGVVDSATLTTSAVGTASGTAVSNLPPYYALIFIMRIS
jgi:microcystin-dependent protein